MMTDWDEKLAGWASRFVEIRIEDQAGEDPLAPPSVEMLHRVRIEDERSAIRFYFGPQRYLSVPLFDDEALTACAGKTFRSFDRRASLVYRVTLI